jgi:hypothetical protein
MNDYGHKVQVWSADWDHLHARIAKLEAALRELLHWTIEETTIGGAASRARVLAVLKARTALQNESAKETKP